MCGIAGFLGDYDAGVLAAMANAIAHRGPDGEGAYLNSDGPVGLAHRRLAIIDLSPAGAQPMESADGRYITVFNGEIYNYKEIAEFLKVKKYKFNPHSDTAVLAPLYDLEGPDMLQRLEGMFAFAIYDTHERRLFVARDHAGIKPLYYAQTVRGLAFASELKALLPLPDLNRTPDATALAEYLTFLWTPDARTQLQGVRKLRPGHFMEVRMKQGRAEMNISRWYWPPQAPLSGGKPLYDQTKTPKGLREVFDAVVAEQCTSDVPVGAFLSGGVDSSAIVASMVATGNRPAQTYCIGFTGQGMAAEGFDDDLAFAGDVAKQLDVPFKPLMVEMEPLLARLPELAWMLDEPTADVAPLFVRDISAQARADGIKVLLGGCGGDEVFSGFRRHQTARVREIYGNTLCQIGAHVARGVAAYSGGTVRRRFGRLEDLFGADDESFLLQAFTTNSQPDAANLLHDDMKPAGRGAWQNALTVARAESQGQELLNRLLYMEWFGFLPDHNLNYNDKAAMLAGVEGRVPFTDRRLLAYMADVAPSRKLTGGHFFWPHQTAPKAFFKSAMGARLPQSVLGRSKAGFGAPLRTYLKSGPGRAMMEGALLDSPIAADLFDRARLENFWNRTLKGQVDGAYTMLGAAMIVWWFQQTAQ
ncbi:MAG: asparagine synthase (glutamine-hydrolyzing) [Pseudomonadaceae bacterium]|nr:asparagine synthase (glutamine-hydrolyzing) [Pseudomonadaceae bacterium]